MADFKKITTTGDIVKLDGTPAPVSSAAPVVPAGDPVVALVEKYGVPIDLLTKMVSKKATIESIILANLDGLQRDLIMEKYYQGMSVKSTIGGGSAVWRQQLGVVQQSIKGKTALVEYLTPLLKVLN